MRVLVTGAYGFIGSAVTARLVADGFEVLGLGRDVARSSEKYPNVRWIALDIAKASAAKDWLPHLKSIDAVVNCAGVLQDGAGDDVKGVHADGTIALFRACEQASVKRVVHISAIGVDADTAFARTKREADEALMKSSLDWIVLRPSIVAGRNVYGGTALIRALASLPVLPLGPRDALLQPVQVKDLAAAVAFFLRPDAPTNNLLELAGPERVTLSQVVAQYRKWLGYKPAPVLRIPGWLETLAFRLGDLAGLLGWRPPVRTTALKQLRRDVIGDDKAWTSLTGINATRLPDALARDPASVQQRWFSKLFLLKPVLIGGLALFWIATGLITLGPAREAGIVVLLQAGLGGNAVIATLAGALLDLAIGIGIAVRKTSRFALWTAIAVSLGYLLLSSLLMPNLWLDPLGPLVKIVPILLASFVALAILDDR